MPVAQRMYNRKQLLFFLLISLRYTFSLLKLLKELELSINDIGTDLLINKLDGINIEEYKDKLNIDIYTLEDIIMNLKNMSLSFRLL